MVTILLAIFSIFAFRFRSRAALELKLVALEHQLAVVPVGNSRSDILMVQSAQNWHGQRLTDTLDGAGDRRVLLQ